MTTMRPWLSAAVLAVVSILGWGTASAAASEIADEAKFFSPEVVAKATEDLNQLEKRSRFETRIETYDSMSAEQKAAYEKLSSKSDKDKFYSNWLHERALAVKAKGLFVLITRNPSHLHLDVSRALRLRGFSGTQGTELREILIKRFAKKEFDAGLTDAVAYLERFALRMGESHSTAPAGYRTQQGAGPNAPNNGQGMGIMGWIILGVVVFFVFSLISALVRGLSGGGQGYAPGYGQPGYGGGYGGGGFFSNMLGGLAGAMAGNWLYDSMSGHHHGQAQAGDWSGSSSAGGYDQLGGDTGGGDFSGGWGGDFGGGGGDFGGGDFGGGGDF